MSLLPLRSLGAGPRCSVLTLGTAALAAPYAGRPAPLRTAALRMIWEAVDDLGVNLIDTAPGYGSEELVGKVLAYRPEVMIATKVTAVGGIGMFPVWRQIELSLSALQRDRIDLLQIHNATAWAFRDGRAMADLHEAKAKGQIRLLGASVYTAEEAFAACRAGVDVLQVPYNLLDQRMRTLGVLTVAREAGVAVLARSVWLRGALAGARGLPDVVEKAARRAKALLVTGAAGLPGLALRFALEQPVASLVVGPRTSDELRQAVSAALAGPLPWWRRALTPTCACQDPLVVDPRTWPVLA